MTIPYVSILRIWCFRSSVVERGTSNRKTLGSIPWRGRVNTPFSVPPSQLLCCADLFVPDLLYVYGTHTQMFAHVKDPISICRKE